MSARRVLAALVVAVTVTLLSTAVKGTRTEYQGWDCPPGVRECPKPMVAAGLPLPYVVDHEGISTGNSASLLGAAVGEDLFRPAPFVADVAFWLLLALAAGALLARARRPGGP